MTTLYRERNKSTGHVHTLVVKCTGHAQVGNSAIIDLVHGFLNMHAAQPSVWHVSALVIILSHCQI